MNLYQQCTSFGQRLKDLVTKTEEMKWDVRRGVLAAVLDLVKTALAIQDLKNTLDTLPFAVVAEVMGIEVPGLSLAKVDDLKNMAYGAVAALQEPPRVLAALGQKIGDTVEEEGIAYSISYVAADVAIRVLLSKGLSEVKNVSKADDLVDVARTVDTLDDTVKIADELTDAAKVVDQVGDIKDVAMAVNAVDEANAAVKAVDKVDDVADAVKTVERLDNVIEGGADASFTWKLRGEDVTLNDVKVQEISYVKRNSTELKTLRDEFNTTTRKAFLEDLGNNTEYLRNAGFSETDILKIQNGRVPDGWQVHHKLPLDDSGVNSFDNLVLIQNEPYHKVITNYQNSIARQMDIGEAQAVQWPRPNGNIYPAQH